MAHRVPRVETDHNQIELTPELKVTLKNTVAELQKQGGIHAITQDVVTDFVRSMTGALINAALQGEMDYHLTTEANASREAKGDSSAESCTRAKCIDHQQAKTNVFWPYSLSRKT